MRRRGIIGFFAVSGMIVAMSGSAFAQDFRPGISLNTDSRPLTPEEQEKRKAVDDAYRSTLSKVPDKKKSSDPWGNLRSPTTTSSKQRQ